mmetsp:Transcript_38570/g.90627  ORF Transcript_38570/g.90627 Transcript_38570/m.90627 type:complete len:297 (+) Transcript_38570:122-1012(+)
MRIQILGSDSPLRLVEILERQCLALLTGSGRAELRQPEAEELVKASLARSIHVNLVPEVADSRLWHVEVGRNFQDLSQNALELVNVNLPGSVHIDGVEGLPHPVHAEGIQIIGFRKQPEADLPVINHELSQESSARVPDQEALKIQFEHPFGGKLEPVVEQPICLARFDAVIDAVLVGNLKLHKCFDDLSDLVEAEHARAIKVVLVENLLRNDDAFHRHVHLPREFVQLPSWDGALATSLVQAQGIPKHLAVEGGFQRFGHVRCEGIALLRRRTPQGATAAEWSHLQAGRVSRLES